MDSVRGMVGSVRKSFTFKRPRLSGHTDGTAGEDTAGPTPPSSSNSQIRPSFNRGMSHFEYKMAPTEAMAHRVAQHHKLIRQITGFLIHPLIQSSLLWNAKIADLNTGTGVFLTELCKDPMNKDYTLVGFGTMPEIFPLNTSATSGPSVTFEVHNILRPHPRQRHESFDSVHTSFLGPVLVGNDWDNAFDNMMALAKPEGWIQWIDVNLSSRDNKDRIYVSKPNTNKASYIEMMEGIAFLDAWFDNKVSGGKRLKEIAKRHIDVESVWEDVFNTAQLNEVRVQIDILSVQAWKRLLGQLPAVAGWDSARVERVTEGMIQEAKNQVYIPLEVYVVVAQKKSAAKLAEYREKEKADFGTKAKELKQIVC
ncbi:hypothetical protein BKA65DRAFT_195232 [Rhexocercosporidium sp. MPI-PUGE-AT-0058]|nr:hypothetical protein BKA65DRAFT_195232 [Rhexocercosporidium sp. MPI-PUGE-AT-0058]